MRMGKIVEQFLETERRELRLIHRRAAKNGSRQSFMNLKSVKASRAKMHRTPAQNKGDDGIPIGRNCITGDFYLQ
jgi:hypothetical protein